MKNSIKISKRKSRRSFGRISHAKRTVLETQCHRCISRNKKRRNRCNSQRWIHPDIGEYLEINKSKKFGRYIKAAQSIEAGKVVIITAPFACGMLINQKNQSENKFAE